jgi:4-amino-4-deoxy-L-arabinose transferase-like glycosyltransferase
VIKDAPPRENSIGLVGTALFAFGWVVARACIQSITIDEAATFRAYVGTPTPAHWEPASNNHVLNSMLMRLSTSLLGVSNLTMRLPAILGAAIYIAAAYLLARLVGRTGALAWALLACLTLNPFVMDYLVAARGYSLALGFLMAAMAVAARRQAEGADPRKTCVVCSVLMGLSFAANFSFALADAAVLAGIALWCWRGRKGTRELARIAASAVLPGLAVALYLTGSVVANWPKNEFRWGATTFAWFLQSVVEQSFSRLSPYLVSPPVHAFLLRCQPLLLPALALVVSWRVAVLVRERCDMPWTGAIAGGSVVAAVGLHSLLVWRFHLLWPLGRTGLYVAPLCVLAAGAAAGTPCASKMGRVSGRAVTAVLLAMACYFVLCLRLTWFTEWYWNANADRVYNVVAWYNHRYGVTTIGTNWRYVEVLNFYRERSGRESLKEVLLEHPVPQGRPLYVLFPGDDAEFARREGLKEIFHDPVSDAVVAIRPEVERDYSSSRP